MGIEIKLKFKKFNIFLLRMRIYFRCLIAKQTKEQIGNFIDNEINNHFDKYVKVVTNV